MKSDKTRSAPVFINDIGSANITDTATRKSEYVKRGEESQGDSSQSK